MHAVTAVDVGRYVMSPWSNGVATCENTAASIAADLAGSVIWCFHLQQQGGARIPFVRHDSLYWQSEKAAAAPLQRTLERQL